MNIKIKYALTATIIFILAGLSRGQETKSFLSIQDILSVWQNNYGKLNSMKVSYSEHLVSYQPPSDSNIRLTEWTFEQRTEEGKKFYLRSSHSENGFGDINSIEEVTFDGIHQRDYLPARKIGQIHQGLFKQNPRTNNRFKRYLLSDADPAQRGIESQETEFVGTINSGLTDPNLMISIRPNLEEIAGQMCHVIEVFRKDTPKDKAAHIIWVAHEKGMLPMMNQQLGPMGIIHEITVEQIEFAKTQSGGLWYPKKGYEYVNASKSVGIMKYEFNVYEFVPGIKTDVNNFRLDFPNGTHIFDNELGIDYTVGVK
jgi:hypothetical protein